MFGVLDAHVPDVDRATHTHAVRATRRTSISKRSTNWSTSDILIVLTEAEGGNYRAYACEMGWVGWGRDTRGFVIWVRGEFGALRRRLNFERIKFTFSNLFKSEGK